MRVRIRLQSDGNIRRELQRIANRIPEAAGRALHEEGQTIITRAKSDPSFPVDTGALRASGTVDAPKTRGRRVEVDIGFGGPAAPYALYVHEGTKNMQARKYLEKHVLEAQRGWAERLARRLQNALR
jgi:hypothetical protein